MPLLFVLIAVGFALVGVTVGVALRRIASAWLKFRGQFIVTCPADRLPASVRVDTLRAAATAWRSTRQLRLAGCSRWPERAGCEQGCNTELGAAPENCLLRTILAKWYEGKCCVRCGQPVAEAYWTASMPALLTSVNVIDEWGNIPVEDLPRVLDTARPVCFHCYVQDKVNPREQTSEYAASRRIQ